MPSSSGSSVWRGKPRRKNRERIERVEFDAKFMEAKLLDRLSQVDVERREVGRPRRPASDGEGHGGSRESKTDYDLSKDGESVVTRKFSSEPRRAGESERTQA